MGNFQTAIGLMRSVLAETPAYGPGWTQLWDWCLAAGNHPGCVEAGEALVRLGPQNAVNLRYLGEAKRLNKDLAVQGPRLLGPSS